MRSLGPHRRPEDFRAAPFHVANYALIVVRGQHLRGVDKTAPLAFNSPYPYWRTKALAEQAVCDGNCAGWCVVEATARP